MKQATQLDGATRDELLCIADSNWVLGHWYIVCILNGRELTDFTSMAGIAEDKLGHARALFRFLEEYDELPEFQLEFARPAQRIHAMEMLDSPPRNWADFVLTLYLADKALWRFADTLRQGNFAPVASLVTKFGEEAYYHQLCIDGWLKALDEGERAELTHCLPTRLATLMPWFECAASDPLIEAGIRTESLEDARNRLQQDVKKDLGALARRADLDYERTEMGRSMSWDPRRRRQTDSAVPARLWETMVPTSEAAKLARRPLAVSIDDNIDLFGTGKKDDTEPDFQ